MPKISTKHQITLPVDALREAGLREGDEVTVSAQGPDSIVVRRAPRTPEDAFGVFDGLYEPGYLDDLRAGERA